MQRKEEGKHSGRENQAGTERGSRDHAAELLCESAVFSEQET